MLLPTIMEYQFQLLHLRVLLVSLTPSFLLSVSAIMPDLVTGLSLSRELLMSLLHHFDCPVEQWSFKTLLDGNFQHNTVNPLCTCL